MGGLSDSMLHGLLAQMIKLICQPWVQILAQTLDSIFMLMWNANAQLLIFDPVDWEAQLMEHMHSLLLRRESCSCE